MTNIIEEELDKLDERFNFSNAAYWEIGAIMAKIALSSQLDSEVALQATEWLKENFEDNS